MSTAQRMHTAGADAFNQGKPCVPGLDALWHRELREIAHAHHAACMARYWRTGWAHQARLVERVRVPKRHPTIADLQKPPFTRSYGPPEWTS